MFYKMILSSGIATLLLAQSALAAVVSGNVTSGTAFDAGGTFVELDPASSFSVGDDNFQSPNLYAFDEDQNITLGADLGISGPTDIATGTVIASHYLFFDPGPNQSISGSVTFDALILGVAVGTTDLNNSDFLISNAVTYLSPGLRGLEAGDDFQIIGNTFNVIDWFAGSPGDYVRVFTARSPSYPDNTDPGTDGVVPLPAAGWMLLSSLGGLLVVASRRRRRAA